MIVVFKSWIGSAVHVLNVICLEWFKPWIGSAVHIVDRNNKKNVVEVFAAAGEVSL